MPSGTNGRYSGLEQQLQSTWDVNTSVTVVAAYVHFAPAEFLQSHRAITDNLGMAQISFRFLERSLYINNPTVRRRWAVDRVGFVVEG